MSLFSCIRERICGCGSRSVAAREPVEETEAQDPREAKVRGASKKQFVALGLTLVGGATMGAAAIVNPMNIVVGAGLIAGGVGLGPLLAVVGAVAAAVGIIFGLKLLGQACMSFLGEKLQSSMEKAFAADARAKQFAPEN